MRIKSPIIIKKCGCEKHLFHLLLQTTRCFLKIGKGDTLLSSDIPFGCLLHVRCRYIHYVSPFATNLASQYYKLQLRNFQIRYVLNENTKYVRKRPQNYLFLAQQMVLKLTRSRNKSFSSCGKHFCNLTSKNNRQNQGFLY